MEIATEKRIQWINILKKCLEKNKFNNFLDEKKIFNYARRIEEYCHRERQQIKKMNNISIYQYNQKQILFDDYDAHIHAATNQYIENIRKFAYIFLEGNIQNVQYDLPENYFNNEKIIEGTDHEIWEKSYYSKQLMAKQVLSKESITKGLFSCPKCKSFDVDTDQKQTRSSDEPMTIFCNCNACGKRFIR